MDAVLSWLGMPLGAIMRWCYFLCRDYGVAILLFTLISKVILLPLGVFVHKNAIKLVRMQPKINDLHIRFFGDSDAIAREQSALYKQEKYNAFISLVPLCLQLLLLMGLVDVIYHPIKYLFSVSPETLQQMYALAADRLGVDAASSSIELSIVMALRDPQNFTMFAELVNDIGWEPLVVQMRDLNTVFLGVELTAVPQNTAGLWFVPLIAGGAAYLLCFAQNSLNVLQHEQGKLNKYGTMALSVGLSLYLGFFVPCGLALYWTLSNLLAIVQLLVLNAVINPKKYVDFAALNESKARLAALKSVGQRNDAPQVARALKKRERADYKRFFSILNKHVVFYSENSGFYKYYEEIITQLLKRTNLTIHYITSDPDDAVFALSKQQPRIAPYYIGLKKLITLLMKMDAEIVLMTMPDLDNYHYKRSYVNKDVEYVYVFHYPLSTHMVLGAGALDHYDTILCVGDFQIPEIRKQEALHGLKEKKLVVAGYGQLEKLYAQYCENPPVPQGKKRVLIAPSWQTDNILDTCIDDLLHSLLGKGYDVVVRPHPEYVKRYHARMMDIVHRYDAYQGQDLHFELDFSSNASIFESDVVVTDWSGTAYEFSFVTLKPSVFIDTPPKINNPEYVKFGIEPLELSLRDKIGVRLDPGDLSNAAQRIEALMKDAPDWAAEILALRQKTIANFGSSGEVAARYLIDALKKRADKNKNNHV